MFINNLKEIRVANKLTQEELAEKSEVSRQTIISIEKGVYTPSLELAFKLSEVLNMEITKIFNYKKSKKN
jgi:putative transcriptional regulator